MPQDVVQVRKSQATANKNKKQTKTKFVFQSIPVFRGLLGSMWFPRGLYTHTHTQHKLAKMPQDVVQVRKSQAKANKNKKQGKTKFVFQSIPVFRGLLKAR
jgi:hypothetical protein